MKAAAEDWELLEVKGKVATSIDEDRKRTGTAKKRTVDAITLGTERLASTRTNGMIPQFNKTTIAMALGQELEEGLMDSPEDGDELPPPPDVSHDTGKDGESDSGDE